jgi:2-polyprenyl-3-methyl-5-hydroxy-6-metoxy-1,4-benzoquinol methylase
LNPGIREETALASRSRGLHLEAFDESLSDQEYLDAVLQLSFEGVSWTPERISAVRDLLCPWHHNIKLADGVNTGHVDDCYPAHEEIMKVIAHALGGDFEGVRVMDIGCLEGYFSAELALQGAEVTGVEGRLLNLKKCEFVASALGLQNVRFMHDDAMEVTRERYGSYDFVLAAGLIYHLRDPFTFLENVGELCTGSTVIDTLIALDDQPDSICEGWRPELSELMDFPHRGRSYSGRLYREFDDGETVTAKALSPTASLDNDLSVWLTEESLVQLLHDVGFEQVTKLVYPRDADVWWGDTSKDARVLLLAVKERSRFRSRIFTQA